MIKFNRESFYYVYPSWAKHPLRWTDIGRVFSQPFATGFLTDEARWKKIRYQPGTDKFQLYPGPSGNGIIEGTGDPRITRFYWMAVLLKFADFMRLPGFHYQAPSFNVWWLEEKRTDEHFLGLKKRAEVFVPNVSLDYDECDDSIFFISLSFGTKSQDEELCLRFPMLWHGFGLKCRPADSSDRLPKVTEKLVSPVISHRWFIVERRNDDVGLIAAKAFYLGCAAKHVSRRLKNLLLVGAFEDRPKMAQLWNAYRQR